MKDIEEIEFGKIALRELSNPDGEIMALIATTCIDDDAFDLIVKLVEEEDNEEVFIYDAVIEKLIEQGYETDRVFITETVVDW